MRKRKAELRIRVDERVRAALRRIGAEEGRTVSELVREAVAEWLRARSGAEEDADWNPENNPLRDGSSESEFEEEQR